MKLSQRKNEILIAIVEDYIKEASPITSSGVQSRHLPNISSATLRAELSTLEAMGYLKQLHTSGGRIPTTEGYRYYVEFLFSNLKVSNLRLEKVKEILNEKTKSVSEIIAELAKIISEVTNSSTVIMMNGYNNLVIEEIKIVSLIDKSALILIKTKNGIVSNTIKISASQKDCDDAGRLLTKRFANKTIGYMIENIAEVKNAINKEVKKYKNLIECLIGGLKKFANSKVVGIKQSGTVRLLECGEENATKKVLNLLEDESGLQSMLETEENDVSCKLADDEDKYSGLAVVKAPLIVRGKNVGSVGVLGPQRMDYKLIASAIEYLTSELENIDKLQNKEGTEWQKEKTKKSTKNARAMNAEKKR
ncbi:MAG: heat-inducible transcriptional repressor HrcA [Clostridia bacterium]|nr:heat-inducible transcriptional repressor HrcA [Clostridia bacterium]